MIKKAKINMKDFFEETSSLNAQEAEEVTKNLKSSSHVVLDDQTHSFAHNRDEKTSASMTYHDYDGSPNVIKLDDEQHFKGGVKDAIYNRNEQPEGIIKKVKKENSTISQIGDNVRKIQEQKNFMGNSHDLLDMPHKIMKQEIELLDLNIKLEDLKKQLKIWEDNTYLEVSKEINKDGKPLYSNDGLRNAEVQNRKTENIKLLECNISNFVNNLKTTQIELGYLNNIFSALKAISYSNFKI